LVSLGAIDTGGVILPIANVFCRSKLPWSFELSEMINHEVHLPGYRKARGIFRVVWFTELFSERECHVNSDRRNMRSDCACL